MTMMDERNGNRLAPTNEEGPLREPVRFELAGVLFNSLLRGVLLLGVWHDSSLKDFSAI